MSKKFIVASLIALTGSLAGAWATYEAPAHAEERKYQLEQERLAQQARARTMPSSAVR